MGAQSDTVLEAAEPVPAGFDAFYEAEWPNALRLFLLHLPDNGQPAGYVLLDSAGRELARASFDADAAKFARDRA